MENILSWHGTTEIHKHCERLYKHQKDVRSKEASESSADDVPTIKTSEEQENDGFDSVPKQPDLVMIPVEGKVQHMLDTFVKDGSDLQVNISNKQRKKIEDDFKTCSKNIDGKSEVSGAIFEEARHEIFDLMRRDSLPRFKASAKYLDFLNCVKLPE